MQNDFYSPVWADHHRDVSRRIGQVADWAATGTRRLLDPVPRSSQLLAGIASLALTGLVVTGTTF